MEVVCRRRVLHDWLVAPALVAVDSFRDIRPILVASNRCIIASMMATRCEQHARLGRAYEDAAKAYLSAVGQLRENIGTSTRVEYGELADRAGAAREAARRAMKKLQEHAFKHRCSAYGIGSQHHAEIAG